MAIISDFVADDFVQNISVTVALLYLSTFFIARTLHFLGGFLFRTDPVD
jgi:hypothetical protein